MPCFKRLRLKVSTGKKNTIDGKFDNPDLFDFHMYYKRTLNILNGFINTFRKFGFYCRNSNKMRSQIFCHIYSFYFQNDYVRYHCTLKRDFIILT